MQEMLSFQHKEIHVIPGDFTDPNWFCTNTFWDSQLQRGLLSISVDVAYQFMS